jgi:glycosyltransferase involved in cell wall biosynthesis
VHELMSRAISVTVGPMVDVVHLAFAGLGGHRAVVEGITTQHAAWGVSSAAVLVAPTVILHQTPTWKGPVIEVRVPIVRRGDVQSMIAVGLAVRRLRPKVVICHTYRHLPAAWLGAISLGRPPRFILVEHQSFELRTNSSEFWSLVGTFLSRATVLLSESYARGYRWTKLSRLLGRRIEVIGNGVVIEARQPTRTRTESIFRVGMAGRLIPSKDFASLIGAIARLRVENIPYELSIAGDGSELRPLKELASMLGVADCVKFMGALSGEEMDGWYSSLDCYVQSTFGETMSMSVLEAAAHKVPLVLSDVQGVRDMFLPNKSALILQETNANSIAEAIRFLRERPDMARTLSDLAFEYISEHHSTRSMALSYLDLVRSLGGTSSNR